MFDQTFDNLDGPSHRFDVLQSSKTDVAEVKEEEEEEEKLAHVPSPNEVRKDYDSKPCDCDEYEVSGDCNHSC